MTFTSADFILGAVVIAAAMLGLFGGFSGALGFCSGVVAAGATVKFGHEPITGFLTTAWAAALATLVVALLAFGLARALVKRLVKGLLAQPADALFGSLIAAVTGACVALAAIFAANRLMQAQIQSTVYSLVMGYLGC